MSPFGRDVLTQLRRTLTLYVVMLLLFGLSLLAVGPDPETARNVPLAIGALAAGVVSLFAGWFFERQRPLDCTDEATLATSYRTRFFLRLACASAAGMYGFIGFFLAAVWWVYPASLITTAVGYRRLAPTEAHLVEDQEALNDRGCRLSLIEALRQPLAA